MSNQLLSAGLEVTQAARAYIDKFKSNCEQPGLELEDRRMMDIAMALSTLEHRVEEFEKLQPQSNGEQPQCYKWHSDPGHAWLEVSRKELERLGVDRDISTYSYERGGTVYLEEDMDAEIFLKAKQQRGEPHATTETFTREDSIVRSYPPYHPQVRT